MGWYKIYTHSDFFPRPKGLGTIHKGKSFIKYRGRWKKDHIYDLIQQASQNHQIPEALLTAVIEVESGFNTNAVSLKGAIGLTQLMPQAQTRFNVQRPYDPKENIEGGAKYLSYLLHEWALKFPYHRRLELSLAAYNAGEKNVELYGGIPPFKETTNYVRKVLKKYKSLNNNLSD